MLVPALQLLGPMGLFVLEVVELFAWTFPALADMVLGVLVLLALVFRSVVAWQLLVELVVAGSGHPVAISEGVLLGLRADTAMAFR